MLVGGGGGGGVRGAFCYNTDQRTVARKPQVATDSGLWTNSLPGRHKSVRLI